MKHSLKNTFPLYGKTASSGKQKNGFHQQEKFFRLKLIPPNFNHGFQQQKNAANKSRLFPLDRKYVSTRRNEGFVEKYVLIRC